jgi:tRNA dimethylallyltransferase
MNLYIIAGPTACGKTAAAIRLAKKLGGEIVSADSMQVYRRMDIGTAKPTLDEREGVPHHMLDVVDPDEPFSVAVYQQMAAEAIAEIHARGRMPILTGGTGFYINAVLYGNDFGGPVDEAVSGGTESQPLNGKRLDNSALRSHFENIAAERGNDYLHQQLALCDPEYAASIHPNNVRRVINALAFFYTTGKKISEHNREQRGLQAKYDTRFIVLNTERAELYRRIDERVLQMFAQGLEDEVRGLLAAGYHTGLTSMQGIGYKETAAYLEGRLTREETVELIQRGTRRYAKRQLTWFRHQAKGAEWIDAGKGIDVDDV